MIYIEDGDSKTYKGILNVSSYGDPVVQKKRKECVGHVEKRMSRRLRNVKRTNKGVGGKGSGKLTESASLQYIMVYRFVDIPI